MTNNSDLKVREGFKMLSSIDFVYLLVKRRRLIFVNLLVLCMLAVIISLILPKTYTATAVIMPQNISNNLLSSLPVQLQNIGGIGEFSTGFSQEVNTFIAILNSRTLAESTINNFDLMKRYDSEFLDDAIIIFRKKIYITIDEEGTIRINVSTSTDFFHPAEQENESKRLCADIANFMVSELNNIYLTLQTQAAKNNRIFLEKRYNENKADLMRIEEALKEFSEKNGLISLPDQVKAAINTAAQIKSQILIKEVELNVLKNTLNPENYLIQKYEIEISELNKKLNKLKFGVNSEDSISILPPFSKAPDLGMKYFRLQRELEVQNILYTFLTQQYEKARLEEVRDTPNLQILDKAFPPDRRKSPKRKIIVIGSAVFSFLSSILLILIIDYFQRIKTNAPTEHQKLSEIWNALKIWR